MDLEILPGNGAGLGSANSGYYKLLLDTLNYIYEEKDLSKQMNHILGMIGELIHVSRAYVFEDDYKRGVSCNTYEWCAEGVTPEKDILQAVPHADVRGWHEMLAEHGIIRANDLGESPGEVTALLEVQKKCSILVLPLTAENERFGFIGFDECRQRREWTEQEVELLRALSGVVAALISRNKMEHLLRASHRRFRTVMDNIQIPVYVSDLETNKILFANKKFVEEVRDENVEGKICWKALQRHPDGRCPDCPRERLLSMPAGSVYSWEVHNALIGKWYYCTDSLIEWVDGRRAHLQSAVEITARKELEERLILSASCDAMTGVYNRESGLRLVRDLMETGRRENFTSTFCYIDLDDLKQVNDTFGHAEGDKLIFKTVEAISSIVRNTDIFARLGGDEFMVALRSCNIPNARRVISNVVRKLEQLNHSGEHPYMISFSVGFAEIHPNEICDVEDILTRADMDMYANKHAKKDE